MEMNRIEDGLNPEIIWRNIDYSIDAKKGVKNHILNDLSGCFKFSELTAIMGPSGSGKTTLLECISGKRKGFSGRIEPANILNPILSIIPQINYFLPEFTVKEVLWYASHLKNKTTNHESIIEGVIEKLSLESCMRNRVTKCSGGELKRLAIAQELVSPTDILILDEPTSGLDSASCLEVIEELKKLSRSRTDRPMAVVASIHQPSTRVFELFDKIYAITFDGQCIYEDSPLKVVEILHNFGFECPMNFNPADYLIEVCYDKHRIEEKSQMIAEHKTKYTDMNSPEFRVHVEINTTQKRESIFTICKPNNKEVTESKVFCRNFEKHIRHVRFLFQRAIKAIIFNRVAITLQVGTYTTSPVGISLLYHYKIGSPSGCPQAMANMTENQVIIERKGIEDNLAFIFFAFLLFMMGGIMTTVLTFPIEMNVLKAETRNKWYKCWTYFIGRSLADFPFQIVFPVVFCAIAYYMTGQIQDLWRFSLFSLLMIFVSFCAQTQGMIMGALFMDNVVGAVFIAVTSTVPIMLFGGYFMRIASMPEWGKWLSFISYFRYTYEAIVLTLYGFDRCSCDSNSTPKIGCQSQVLTEFNIIDDDLYKSLIWIISYFIVVRFATYLIILFKISKKS